MDKTLNKYPFYMCTGFHRSGTSLVANTLMSNGVNMGDNLMGASFANQNGHFEDIPIVAIHDKLLNLNATDWRYYADEPLVVPSCTLSKMREYLVRRAQNNQDGNFIGAKDPRAVMFLDAWHQATEGRMKTILVFRDWRLSVSSLLKRHSRQLIQYTSDMRQRPVDMQFWLTPDLAAQMWICSAKAMLNWFKQHASDTLFFDHSSFVTKHQELSKIAMQKGFEPSLLVCHSYEQGLMQQAVPESLQAMMSEKTLTVCEDIQKKLFEQADLCNEENVVTYSSNELAISLVRQSTFQVNDGSVHAPVYTTPNLLDVAWPDLLAILSGYNAKQGNTVDWDTLLKQTDFDANQLDKLFALLMNWGINHIAEQVASKAIRLKPQPWRYMHLGDVYMRKKLYQDAKSNFEKAAELAPDNATFYARLANVETAQGHYDNAQKLVNKARELDATKLAVEQAVNYLNGSRTANKQTKKENSPHQLEGLMSHITDYQDIVDVMTKNRERGLRLDRYMCQSAYVLRNNRLWLMNALSALPSFSQRCFADYIVMHLAKLFPQTVLNADLLLCDLEKSDWKKSEYFRLDTKQVAELPTVGVCIHAFYPHLLPGLFAFVANIPNIQRIVISYPPEVEHELSPLLKQNPLIEQICINNRGRDILPWLSVSARKLETCDIVLKLHTKRTPHQPELAGWRNQLFWQLMDKVRCIDILQAFANDKKLGMAIPNYHPRIAQDINWGQNYEIAKTLADSLKIKLPEVITTFPAGSMFWYRPSALLQLTSKDWNTTNFPEECGQTDGTIMHAVERILPLVAENSGFTAEFASSICLVKH